MRSERRTARAALASEEARLKRNPTDDRVRARVDALRTEYQVLAVEDAIRELVDAAPVLSEAQRCRLAALLIDRRAS